MQKYHLGAIAKNNGRRIISANIANRLTSQPFSRVRPSMPHRTHPIAREVLRKFRIVFGAVRQHYQAVERACGVSGAQAWALASVAESPGLRVKALAETLAIHQSTASNLIDKMERNGLIRRERSTTDLRVVHLHLTPLGEDTLARAPRPFTGALSHALVQMSADQLARLDEDLGQLIAGMDRVDRKAADQPLPDA